MAFLGKNMTSINTYRFAAQITKILSRPQLVVIRKHQHKPFAIQADDITSYIAKKVPFMVKKYQIYV